MNENCLLCLTTLSDFVHVGLMAKIERTPSPYTLFLTEKLKDKVGPHGHHAKAMWTFR